MFIILQIIIVSVGYKVHRKTHPVSVHKQIQLFVYIKSSYYNITVCTQIYVYTYIHLYCCNLHNAHKQQLTSQMYGHPH